MERGIRQRDPASVYSFILVMEILTNQILRAKYIQGIPIRSDVEVSPSQYADDLILFPREELCPIKTIFHELQEFSKVSGMHINADKTKFLQIGQPVDAIFVNDLGVNDMNELKAGARQDFVNGGGGSPDLSGAPGPRGPWLDKGPRNTHKPNQSVYLRARLERTCVLHC